MRKITAELDLALLQQIQPGCAGVFQGGRSGLAPYESDALYGTDTQGSAKPPPWAESCCGKIDWLLG
jgi:hypothetical protein